MIITLVLIVLGAVATIAACKSLNSGFELKGQAIDEKEQRLVAELEELREKRRHLKRELEEARRELKNGVKLAAEPVQQPGSLKEWLLNTEVIDALQFSKAEKYADEKNLDMISSLLTLNMITIDTYEKVKKMKLR